jgi:hypothetical protein
MKPISTFRMKRDPKRIARKEQKMVDPASG